MQEILSLHKLAYRHNPTALMTPQHLPLPHKFRGCKNDDNRRIMRSMFTQTPIPRVPSSNKVPIKRPTNSTNQKCLQKRRALRLRDAATPLSTSPRVRTRAQVATAAARVAPPSMGTRSRARQSTVPPHGMSYETATASTRYGLPHMPHNTTGE